MALNNLTYLILFIVIVSLNCNTNITPTEKAYPEIIVSKTENWQTETISFAAVPTDAGNVPILFYLPENLSSKSLIVGLHHQNANKEVWLTSLTAILTYAIESQIAFIAFDLYGHGEWEVNNYNTNSINAETLPTFMNPTTSGISYTLRSFCYNQNLSIDSLQYIGVSLGCFTAMDLSFKGLKPCTMILSAPVPLKTFDGTYSFHNNLDAFKDINLLAISGSRDEYNEAGEVQEWFDLVNSGNKKIIIYDGGHVPPINMIDSCVVFLKDL